MIAPIRAQATSSTSSSSQVSAKPLRVCEVGRDADAADFGVVDGADAVDAEGVAGGDVEVGGEVEVEGEVEGAVAVVVDVEVGGEVEGEVGPAAAGAGVVPVGERGNC